LVPHYLADSEYPVATVGVLDAITTMTGITFRSDALRESGREFLNDVAEQVSNNDELAELVTNLEARHDNYMAENTPPSPFVDDQGKVPSADSIGAELERFLRLRGTTDE
jgi:hypothetical protein